MSCTDPDEITESHAALRGSEISGNIRKNKMKLQPLMTLRRANSMDTPSVLTLQANPKISGASTGCIVSPSSPSSFSSVDCELISSKSLYYTSLRDLLPLASINSPTAGNSGYEISIKNRLVKQAAWAYLQPVASSSESSGTHIFQQLWTRFSYYVGNSIRNFIRFVHRRLLPILTGVIDWLLRTIRAR